MTHEIQVKRDMSRTSSYAPPPPSFYDLSKYDINGLISNEYYDQIKVFGCRWIYQILKNHNLQSGYCLGNVLGNPKFDISISGTYEWQIG